MADNLKIAVILSAVDKMSAIIKHATDESTNKLYKFSKQSNEIAKKSFETGRSAGEIGLVLAEPLRECFEEAEKAEIANKRLEQVYRSMGEKTNEAAESNIKYAKTLSQTIGVDRAQIEATQAKLATFSKVSDEVGRMNGIFDRATAAAEDMAATGFGESTQNAVQLGKALQDPIKGINSLARSGITFSKQEKEKIKTLVESGKQLQAQKIILKAIEMQVKGTAAATATTSAKAKIAFTELKEKIGGALLPIVNKLMVKIMGVIDRVSNWIDKNPELFETIIKVVAGISAFMLALSATSFLVGGIMKAVSIFSGILSFLATAVEVVTTAVELLTIAIEANPIGAIVALIIGAAALIIANWDRVKQFFSNLWTSIKQFFSNAWQFIKNLFENIPIVGDIIRNWDKIKAYFGDLWEGVKQKFTDFMDWIKGIPHRMYEAGKNIITSIWEGIKSMVSKPIDAIKDMATKIREYLPFSPAKVGPLRDIHRVKIVETIAQSIKPQSLTKALRATTAAAMVAVNPVIGQSTERSSFVGGETHQHHITYSPTIHIAGGGDNSKEQFKKLLKEHEKDIQKMIDESARKNNRTKFNSGGDW